MSLSKTFWTDVRRVALGLPETSEGVRHDHRTWFVRDKAFAWERPLRKSDLEALGRSAPHGPILAVRTPDLLVKEVLLASKPRVYFTTPHFDGYRAVLIRLEKITVAELRACMAEGWKSQAPKRLLVEKGNGTPSSEGRSGSPRAQKGPKRAATKPG